MIGSIPEIQWNPDVPKNFPKNQTLYIKLFKIQWNYIWATCLKSTMMIHDVYTPHGCLQVPSFHCKIPRRNGSDHTNHPDPSNGLKPKHVAIPPSTFQPKSCGVNQGVLIANLPFSALVLSFLLYGEVISCEILLGEKQNQIHLKLAKGTICYILLAKNLRNRPSFKCIVWVSCTARVKRKQQRITSQNQFIGFEFRLTQWEKARHCHVNTSRKESDKTWNRRPLESHEPQGH